MQLGDRALSLGLQHPAQLCDLLLQLIALLPELTQFVATNGHIQGLCWSCRLYCAHCFTSQMACLNYALLCPCRVWSAVAGGDFISFSGNGNFFIFRGRRVLLWFSVAIAPGSAKLRPGCLD